MRKFGEDEILKFVFEWSSYFLWKYESFDMYAEFLFNDIYIIPFIFGVSQLHIILICTLVQIFHAIKFNNSFRI